MWGSNSEEVRLADIGVVADGVTDNAPKLLALRDELRTNPNRRYTFVCPPGELRSSDPRWLMGLKNVRVVGYGTRLVSTSTNPSSFLKNPLCGGDIFATNPFTYSGTWTTAPGSRFRSANAGAYAITMATPADATGLAGKWVLLAGFDQQGASSYPPNLRYFEWKTVASADAATGIVIFTEPLLHGYDERWHDVPYVLGTGSTGKPRLWVIDPATVSYADIASFEGLTFGLSLTADSGGSFRGAFSFPARVLRARDVTIEGPCWPTQHLVAEYENCTFNGVEPDKLCGRVSLIDCTNRGHLLAATGVDRLEVLGGSSAGYIEVAPRMLRMGQGVTIGSNDGNPSILPYPLTSPIKRMIFDGVRFAGGPGMTAAQHVQYFGTDRTFTIAATGGGDILIPFTGYADSDPNWELIRSWDYGTKLKRQDGVKSGAIDGIIFDEVNSRWVVSGSWIAPAAGETWVYHYVEEIVSRWNEALDGRALFDTATAALVTDGI